MEAKLGMLVESWARGYGRIVEIYEFAGFVVKFSNGTPVLYALEDLGTVLKVHEEN